MGRLESGAEKQAVTDTRNYQPAADVLQGRVILITGASDGIGKAVAQAAAAHGATVLLHGRNVRKLEAVYDSIVAAKQPRPSIVPLDFEKAGPEEYEKIATALEQQFGRLDALLHNAGMLGERVPDVVEFNPSWHHNYCSVGFWSAERTAVTPHYPATNPELVALTTALHALAYDPSAREAYKRDAAGYASGLSAEHAELLEKGDFKGITALGVHPLVSFLARMQLERMP